MIAALASANDELFRKSFLFPAPSQKGSRMPVLINATPAHIETVSWSLSRMTLNNATSSGATPRING